MIIYPAIDLRSGRVVRLTGGDPLRQTTFSDNPVETARRWIDEGAQWLHIVNLDGAFEQANDNLRVVEQIASLGISVQFGGGLRSHQAVEQAFLGGAARVVLGTAALEDPNFAADMLAAYGSERTAVALDSRDGKVAVRGWQQSLELSPRQLGSRFREIGYRHALFTDVSKDGSLGGSNLGETIALAEATGLEIIASGGISSIGEIVQIAKSKVVRGAIIGMALYRGYIKLQDAMTAAVMAQGE